MANEQDDLVAILREYEQEMADAIARMDCGEVDNGAMRIIRAERHDAYKRAANRIESQDARIEQLQAEVDRLRMERDSAIDQRARLAAELAQAKRDSERLDSGRILISSFDEFGRAQTLHTGINLREAIDAALQKESGNV